MATNEILVAILNFISMTLVKTTIQKTISLFDNTNEISFVKRASIHVQCLKIMIHEMLAFSGSENKDERR